LAKGKKGSSGNDSLVFYSEGKQYWNVFEPILSSLSQKNVRATYLTSDKNDQGLVAGIPGITAKFIGKTGVAFSYLQQIRADVLTMTTPQLDVLTLKRSKGVKHYAHVVHAPADVFTYRKFAFDYFDSVFCSGEHQIESIRKLEKKRGTKPKELFKVGCTYYDYMTKNIKPIARPVAQNQKKILVAPTWAEFSLLNQFGFELCEKILNIEKYAVVLRPHPQTYVSYPEVIEKIEKQFAKHPRFQIDRTPSPEKSMQECDLMISDISGIIWDYVFLFEKPLLIVNTPINLKGFEGSELDHLMWELKMLSKEEISFRPSDLENLEQKIEMVLNQNPMSTYFKKIKEESVYNWGRAGSVAAETILEIQGRTK
jgi:hypothetical protein